MKSTLNYFLSAFLGITLFTIMAFKAEETPPPTVSIDPFIGEIVMFGGNFAPSGWAQCNGQLLSIAQNQALFSILGTTYGGDGETTFGLPDLRGRSPIGTGNGPGLSTISLGEKSGLEYKTLSVNEIPAHNHNGVVKCYNQTADETNPMGSVIGVTEGDFFSTEPSNANMAPNSVEIGNTGGGQSFSIRDPYIGMNYIIALYGVFPSQN